MTTVPRASFPAPQPGDEIPAHYDGCFACGTRPGGLKLRTVAGPDETMWSEFTPAVEHQGAPGIAHGGTIAAAFDEALGMLAHYTRLPAVTGQLSTSFRKPAPVATTLHIESRIDRRDGRKIHVSATAHLGDREGPVAAEATAVFITVPIEHFTQHGRPEDVEAAREVRAARRAQEAREQA